MGWEIAIYVALMVLTILLTPKPPEPRPASLSDFKLPTADASRPVPVVFGTVDVTGPNVVWYGHLRIKSIKKSTSFLTSSVTVGYKYYLGIHFALCHSGADSITRIEVGEKEAWSGTATGGSITISKKGLFGGEDKEGGITGSLDILMGDSAQAANTYLVAQQGAPTPAYRGVVSVVLNQVYIGTSAYPKPWSFRVVRTAKLTTGDAQWNPTKADISGDLNPVHIIREALTSTAWGMGYNPAQIDNTSFTAAANTLHTETFGLSLQWVKEESIEKFVQTIAEHISASIYVDTATGLFTINLIRDDYTPAALPLFDESNTAEVTSFERRGWGETINELTVTYSDRTTSKDQSITVQDLGNIEMQGGVVKQTRDYAGITNGDLAGRVAIRDLKAGAAPLSRIDIKVNRDAWDVNPGDPFRFSWDDYGLVETVYRVLVIDTGSLKDGTISVKAIEDVFGLSTNVYTTPQSGAWVLPNNDPTALTIQQGLEASYWDVHKNVDPGNIGAFGTTFGMALTHGVRTLDDAYDYNLLTKLSTDATYIQRTSDGDYVPTALLDQTLGIGEGGMTGVTLQLKSAVDLDFVEVPSFAYLDDEMVAVTAVNTALVQITVNRGVLDTVPKGHASDVRLWFADGVQGIDPTEWVTGNTVNCKLLPSTGLGTLTEGAASAVNAVMAQRYQRPYAPGNLKFNASVYPATIGTTLDVALTWAHRDRTAQLDALHTQSEASIGPESGVTYTIRVYNQVSTLGRTVTGLTGTTYTYTQAFETTDFGSEQAGLRFEVEAVNSGALVSRQYHNHSITRV